MLNFPRKSVWLLCLLVAITSCQPSDEIDEADIAYRCPMNVQLDKVDQEIQDIIRRLQFDASEARASDSASYFDVLKSLSMTYEMNGFPQAALSCYQALESHDRSSTQWPYYQALLLAAIGQQESALQAGYKAAALDPTYHPIWLWIGRWSLELGRFDDAEVAFQHVNQGTYADAAKLGIARAYASKGRSADVLTLLSDVEPHTAHPLLVREKGLAFVKLGDVERSKAFLAHSAAVGWPTWPDELSQAKKAFVLSPQARVLDIQKHLEAALQLPESSPQRHDLLEQGLENARTLVNARPLNIGAYSTYTALLRVIDGDEEYKSALLEGIDRFPDSDVFAAALAEYYISRGAPRDARFWLERSHERNSTNPWIYVQLGKDAEESAQYDVAEQMYKKAIEVDRNSIASYISLFLLYQSRGLTEQAAELLPDVAQLNDGSKLTAEFLIQAFTMVGDSSNARDVLAAIPDQVISESERNKWNHWIDSNSDF